MRIEKEFILESYFELEKCLVKWMEILELNNWEIVIKFNDKLNSLAKNEFNGINKQAVISLLTYQEFVERNFEFYWDMEETIVHELLHIKFVSLMRSLGKVTDSIDYQEECLVEELARIMILQDRRNK